MFDKLMENVNLKPIVWEMANRGDLGHVGTGKDRKPFYAYHFTRLMSLVPEIAGRHIK